MNEPLLPIDTLSPQSPQGACSSSPNSTAVGQSALSPQYKLCAPDSVWIRSRAAAWQVLRKSESSMILRHMQGIALTDPRRRCQGTTSA